MSIISLLNVSVLNNPAKFTDPYKFEITFECVEPLKDDLEFKLVYVGSSTSSEHDQELDSLLVGPVPLGVSKFVFEADPPRPDLIPQDDLVSITVMLLSCSYRDREFVQVGYYVNNEYDSEELRENPPSRVDLDHVVRNLLAEKPRVTRFNIPWDGEEGDDAPPEQPDADLEDVEEYGNEEEDAQDEVVDDEEADEVDVADEDEEDEESDDDFEENDDAEDDEAELETEADLELDVEASNEANEEAGNRSPEVDDVEDVELGDMREDEDSGQPSELNSHVS